MPLLRPRYEDFCQAYAAHGNGAEAAREAGFADRNAAHQAYKLLQREDVQARIAELRTGLNDQDAECLAERRARRAQLAALSATAAESLLAKLDPLYEELLELGEYSDVLKVVALQAHIAGLIAPEAPAASARRGGRDANERADRLLDPLGLGGLKLSRSDT